MGRTTTATAPKSNPATLPTIDAPPAINPRVKDPTPPAQTVASAKEGDVVRSRGNASVASIKERPLRLGDPVVAFKNDGSRWPAIGQAAVVTGLGLEAGKVHITVFRHPDSTSGPAVEQLRDKPILEGELPAFRADGTVEHEILADWFVVRAERFTDAFPCLPLGKLKKI